MKNFILLFLLLLSVYSFSQQIISNTFNSKIKNKGFTLYYDNTDSSSTSINKYVEQGIESITTFFSKEFKNDINVYLFLDRNKLDEHWQKDWNMPDFKSQCWMVGSGLESRLDLLSPIAWDEQSCEHDPTNLEEIKQLVYHELTHILHSDYNKSPKFDNINNIDWLVEGLGTYVSGQLNFKRIDRLKKHILELNETLQLSEFWKGEHRYALSGSIVAFIDKTYGRELLSNLLQYNNIDNVLEELNLTEEQLIANWKDDLLK